MLLENKIQSFGNYINNNKSSLIAASTITVTGFLDSFVTQINLKEISDEANPITRLALEQWGIAGLYYTKAIGVASLMTVAKVAKYSSILYIPAPMWIYGAATWYLY